MASEIDLIRDDRRRTSYNLGLIWIDDRWNFPAPPDETSFGAMIYATGTNELSAPTIPTSQHDPVQHAPVPINGLAIAMAPRRRDRG